MGIIFHEQEKTFHLYNKEVSYIIRVMENGQLENCITEKSFGTGKVLCICMRQFPVR